MSTIRFMAKTPPKNSDWLEPPQWWKKYRPLRWVGGFLVIFLLYKLLGPDEAPPPVAVVPKPLPVATLMPSASPASIDLAVAATAVPTEMPTVAPTATPVPATPAPTATSKPTASAVPAATATAAVASEDAAAKPKADEAFVYEKEAPNPNDPDDSAIAEFTAGVSDPVRLIGTFRSYASVDTVMFELERAGFNPIMESSSVRSRVGVPPRDLTTLNVSQFRHWNVAGKLTLQFFNDRLYQSEFEPEDPETYAKAQRRELSQVKSEKTGRAVWVGGNLRIASSLDLAISDVGQKLQSRPFLLWQDRRLVRQRDEWDRRFSLASSKKE